MSSPSFQRFRWSDAAALAREIDDAQAALSAARDSNDARAEIEAACRLGNALTAGDREAEAAQLLTGALIKAQRLGEPVHLAWTLHHLATAEQYCAKHELAQDHFAEALKIATTRGLRDVEHFVWHHRGRCYAEQGDIAEARRCFEKALAIRLEIDEPRAEKARQAIAALDALKTP